MATCAIIPGGGAGSGALKGGGYSARNPTLYIDPDQVRPMQYTVYIHSISKRAHEQPNPVYRNVIIPACPKEKRYFTPLKLQHPVCIPTLDTDNVNGPPKMVYVNAKGLALSICNPSYVGNELEAQDSLIPPEAQISSGECNLTRQGIFASMNEVPTEIELKKAEARREAYYRFRLEEANGLARSDPKKLADILIQDHHMAAEYFGIDTTWHLNPTAKVDCPNCGEKIKSGVAFHYVNGTRCVLDFERASLAGAIKKEDVPEGREWWIAKESPSIEQMTKEQLQKFATELGIEIDLRWSRETLLAKVQEV